MILISAHSQLTLPAHDVMVEKGVRSSEIIPIQLEFVKGNMNVRAMHIISYRMNYSRTSLIIQSEHVD